MARKPRAKKPIPTPNVAADPVVEEAAEKPPAKSEAPAGVNSDICTRSGEVYGTVSVNGGKVKVSAKLLKRDLHENNRDLTRDITDALRRCFDAGREEFAG